MSHPFWEKIMANWEAVIWPTIKSGINITDFINLYLPKDLQGKIIIEYTVGQINRATLGKYYDERIVEFYISPMLNKDNVALMEQLYRAKPAHAPFCVAKYSAQLGESFIPEDNESELYDSLYVQTSHSIDPQKKKLLLNFVLIVRKPFEHLLEKKVIRMMPKPVNQSVDKNANQIVSREVWLPMREPNCDPIMELLIKVVGEINLVNHVGYVEFLPESDPQVKTLDNFYELNELRNNIELLMTREYDYKKCEYCEHIELQCDLLFCANCKEVKYCSKTCQKEHWRAAHKLRCRPLKPT